VTTLPRRLDAVEGLSDDAKEEYIAKTKDLVATDIIPGYHGVEIQYHYGFHG